VFSRPFSMVRMHRHGRLSCLFSTSLRFPKLDVAGSIPVSRSNLFSDLRESGSFCPPPKAVIAFLRAPVTY